MERPNKTLYELQRLSNDIASINRYIYHPGTNRKENDSEHSLTIALLCWYIHTKYNLPLDLSKIFRYAIAHDFAERYAGDFNTFASAAERQKKKELETAALERFKQEFPDFTDMTDFMESYERKADEESLFVWTVDKMQVLLMGKLDNWRPYREYGITYERFLEKHTDLLQQGSLYCKEIYHSILEYSQKNYYDQSSN